jgi:hypothetical protein
MNKHTLMGNAEIDRRHERRSGKTAGPGSFDSPPFCPAPRQIEKLIGGVREV